MRRPTTTSLLKPYESWVDFAGNLKNEASIINFIAAYGTHALITGETTVDGKRAAAMAIIFGTIRRCRASPTIRTRRDEARVIGVPADAEDFLNGTGAYAAALGGLDNVDLWIGGLAEKILPFGGMLGSTFNFVFEVQMESCRTPTASTICSGSTACTCSARWRTTPSPAMIMRNTDATHLPSDVFSTPGLILEVDQTRQFNDLGWRRYWRAPTRPAERHPDPAGHPQQPRHRRAGHATTCAIRATSMSCSAAPRATTSSPRAKATTRSTAMAATTRSRAAPATTSSMPARVTTSSATSAVTTTSSSATATT
jgi:hypothetical protein